MEATKQMPVIGNGVFHPGARPMKVIKGDDGVMYLCDEGCDPSQECAKKECWTCDKVIFNRGG